MNDDKYEPLNIRCRLTLNATREDLGQEVRRIWVECARERPDLPAGYPLEWEQLSEAQKEVDRRIGEGIAKLVMMNLSDEVSK